MYIIDDRSLILVYFFPFLLLYLGNTMFDLVRFFLFSILPELVRFAPTEVPAVSRSIPLPVSTVRSFNDRGEDLPEAAYRPSDA